MAGRGEHGQCENRTGELARCRRPELGRGLGNAEPRPAGGGENAFGKVISVDAGHSHMRTYVEQLGKRFVIS